MSSFVFDSWNCWNTVQHPEGESFQAVVSESSNLSCWGMWWGCSESNLSSGYEGSKLLLLRGNLTKLFQISIVSAYYGTRSSQSLDCTGLAENSYNCTDSSFLKRVEGVCQKKERCILEVSSFRKTGHCAHIKWVKKTMLDIISFLLVTGRPSPSSVDRHITRPRLCAETKSHPFPAVNRPQDSWWSQVPSFHWVEDLSIVTIRSHSTKMSMKVMNAINYLSQKM